MSAEAKSPKSYGVNSHVDGNFTLYLLEEPLQPQNWCV